MGSIESNSSVYSKMPGFPFISKCPACENSDYITWSHSYDNGLETIDDEGNIHCEKCGLDEFLMELNYDCGKHNNQYLDPNWKRTVYAISQLATCKNMPDDVCEKIISKILENKNKYK